MPRVEKGSRARNLPPKAWAQQQDAATGSFPTTFRTAVDNRTGTYRTFFDDSINVDYTILTASTDVRVPPWNPNMYDPVVYNYGAQDFLALWWANETITVLNSATSSGTDSGEAYGGRHPPRYIYGTQEPHVGRPGYTGHRNCHSIHFDGITANPINGHGFDNPANPVFIEDYQLSGPSQSFAVSLWAKLNDHTLGGTLFARGTSPSVDYGVWIDEVGNANVTFADATASINYTTFRTGRVIIDGQWHHVVLNFEPGSPPTVFVDTFPHSSSQNDNGGTTWLGFVSTSNPFRVGELPASSPFVSTYPLNGNVDDVMVFERSLTTSEITALYGAPVRGTQFPVGLPEAPSRWLSTELDIAFPPLLTPVVRGIGDVFVSHTPGQSMDPFRDSQRPELDALAVSGTVTQGSFYTSGSDVQFAGIGFQQPLSAKTRIVIDLSVNTEKTFGHSSASAFPDYPMAYYDHGSKTYVERGSEFRVSDITTFYANEPQTYFDTKAIGFSPSRSSFFTFEKPSAANVMANFGFPWHARYNVSASSTMLYPLSGVLSEPFLLEKAVLEFTASYNGNEYLAAGPAICTFFILNQRGGLTDASYTERYYNPDAAAEVIRSTHNSGTMDLITVMQAVRSLDPALGRELNIPTGSWTFSPGLGWTGRFVMSGAVKSPTKNDGITNLFLPSGSGNKDYVVTNPDGGRLGLPTANSRNWIELYPIFQKGGGGTFTGRTLTFNTFPYRTIPYLLLPEDKLICGWQVPFAGDQTEPTFWSGSPPRKGPRMTFPVGEAKLTLFGSHLRVNEDGDVVEHHDTLNQLLSSVALHEVIG